MHIVIVNYRTPELTIDCLRSLAGEVAGMPDARVVIVDNGSGDDSALRIEQTIVANNWSTWVQVLPLPRNGGFACGNNRGIELAGDARYVLLLNSDTIVHRGFLRYCREVMDREPSIGVMSCLLRNADGSPQNVARKFPTPLRSIVASLGLPWAMPRLFAWADIEDPAWDRETVRRDVEWLGGAFMLIRRELIDRIGGLDEDFFFYGEDIEFCHRVRKAGYRCHYDPAVSITHLGGASSDPTRIPSKSRNIYAWQGRYLVQKKCYGRLASAMVRGVDVLGSALRCMKLAATGRRSDREYRFQRELLGMLLRPLRPEAGGAHGGTA